MKPAAQWIVTEADGWSEVVTEVLARIQSQSGWTALVGPLGAGKTTFVQSLVQQLPDGPDIEVSSPTFDLCHHYETQPPVLHYDLYRLDHKSRLADLDWSPELQQGHIVLVEWADRFPFAHDPPSTVLQFSWHQGGGRLCQLLQG